MNPKQRLIEHIAKILLTPSDNSVAVDKRPYYLLRTEFFKKMELQAENDLAEKWGRLRSLMQKSEKYKVASVTEELLKNYDIITFDEDTISRFEQAFPEIKPVSKKRTFDDLISELKEVESGIPTLADLPNEANIGLPRRDEDEDIDDKSAKSQKAKKIFVVAQQLGFFANIGLDEEVVRLEARKVKLQGLADGLKKNLADTERKIAETPRSVPRKVI